LLTMTQSHYSLTPGIFASCMPALEQDISDTLEYGNDTLTNAACQDEPNMRA
jgi:hypothetical protein